MLVHQNKTNAKIVIFMKVKIKQDLHSVCHAYLANHNRHVVKINVLNVLKISFQELEEVATPVHKVEHQLVEVLFVKFVKLV